MLFVLAGVIFGLGELTSFGVLLRSPRARRPVDVEGESMMEVISSGLGLRRAYNAVGGGDVLRSKAREENPSNRYKETPPGRRALEPPC